MPPQEEPLEVPYDEGDPCVVVNEGTTLESAGGNNSATTASGSGPG